MPLAAQPQVLSRSLGGVLDEDRAPLFAGMLGATARALLAFQLQPNYFSPHVHTSRSW